VIALRGIAHYVSLLRNQATVLLVQGRVGNFEGWLASWEEEQRLCLAEQKFPNTQRSGQKNGFPEKLQKMESHQKQCCVPS